MHTRQSLISVAASLVAGAAFLISAPAFAHAQAAPASWAPPIGIPTPPFGITEDVSMYSLRAGETCSNHPEKCYDFGNGLEPYRDAGNGPYTHYVDPSSPAATDSSNPYGSPSKPRKTLPTPSGDGAVIEMHGTISAATGSGHYSFTGGGSAARPMFFRGTSKASRAIFKGLNFKVAGSYIVFENIEFVDTAPDVRPGFLTTNADVPVHHVAFRHDLAHGTSYHGFSNASYVASNPIHDFVYYDDEAYMDGYDPHVPHSEDDRAGVGISPNSYNIWIVDNNLHNVPGDSVGAGHGANYTAHNYYIGRNDLHDTGENAVDLKEVENIVVSQNKMHSFWGASSGAGGSGVAAVIHYGPTYSPKNVWLLMNEVYDENGPAFSVGGSQEYDVYLIGNIVHGIHNGSGTALSYQSWDSKGVYFVNNTIYDVDNGFSSTVTSSGSYFYFANNIISTTGWALKIQDASLKNALGSGTIHHDIFYDPTGAVTVNGGSLSTFKASSAAACVSCVEADPMFASAAGNDVHLQQGSPAIDAGDPALLATLAAQFQSSFGLDISKDFAGMARTQGAAVDLGVYESSGSAQTSQSSSGSSSGSSSSASQSSSSGSSSSQQGGSNSQSNSSAASSQSSPPPVVSPQTFTAPSVGGGLALSLSGVTVSLVTSNSAIVSWATNAPADGQIEYGVTDRRGSATPVDPTRTTSHLIILTDLFPATKYHFIVRSKTSTAAASTTDFTFTTLAASAAKPSPSRPVAAPAHAASTTPRFSRNLYLGVRGDDVRALQAYLNAQGFTVNAAGKNGSPGHETTYFGLATQTAVIRFQIAHGITPAQGYFGPKTRGWISNNQ